MAKYKVAEFGFAIYKDDNKVDVSFKKAKKVPKAYDNFVATLEIACLTQIHKIIQKVGAEDGNLNTKPE